MAKSSVKFIKFRKVPAARPAGTREGRARLMGEIGGRGLRLCRAQPEKEAAMTRGASNGGRLGCFGSPFSQRRRRRRLRTAAVDLSFSANPVAAATVTCGSFSFGFRCVCTHLNFPLFFCTTVRNYDSHLAGSENRFCE